MLKTLRLHNFRTFLNAEINFTQRHLLIGKNNSGKTNLCVALRFLGATASTDLANAALQVPGGVTEITNWAFDSDTVELSCTCELPFDGQTCQYYYHLKLRLVPPFVPFQEGQFALEVADERLIVNGPGFDNVALLRNIEHNARMLDEEQHERSPEESRRYVDAASPSDATMLCKFYDSAMHRRVGVFRRYLASWAYYALSPEAMRYQWRRSPANPGPLSPSGDNLAVVVFHIKNMDEGRYLRILEHVRRIEPDLQAINFIVAPDQNPVPMVDTRLNNRASWQGLSDGTVRCLALASIISAVGAADYSTRAPTSTLIMIEEPENGIYPGRLRAFYELFEEWAPNGQFIFTSHSPYFINLFDGFRDSVTLLRRSNERTEVVPAPPPGDDPDRLMLAEQYSMELFD